MMTKTFGSLSLATLVVTSVLAGGCSPAPAPVPPAPNPDLEMRCGIDVDLVVDRSGSVGAEMAQVASSLNLMLEALVGTESRVRLTSFADTATTHPDASADGTAEIAAASWSAVEAFEVPVLSPGGTTNWEDGLEMVRRAPGGPGELVLVVTDGNPNLHNALRPDGHATITANAGSHLTEATAEANMLKASGSHIMALGVGDVSIGNLQVISGPDAFDPASPAVNTTDYSASADWESFGRDLAAVVQKLCVSKVTIESWVRDPGGKLEPGGPVGVALSVAPEPADWVLPADASGSTAVVDTGKAATVDLAWIPAEKTGSTTVRLTPDEGEVGEFTCLAEDRGTTYDVEVRQLGEGVYEMPSPRVPYRCQVIAAAKG